MTTRYVAFLRGINVGGNKAIKMADLIRIFTSLALQNVKTYIASGNILFETAETDHEALTRTIERGITNQLGYDVKVILRTIQQIESLVSRDPFSRIEPGKDVRLNVTFLAQESGSPLALPYKSPQGEFQILEKKERDLCWVMLSPTARTVDAMAFVEKEFGKASTTRNWNTVQKIAAL